MFCSSFLVPGTWRGDMVAARALSGMMVEGVEWTTVRVTVNEVGRTIAI